MRTTLVAALGCLCIAGCTTIPVESGGRVAATTGPSDKLARLYWDVRIRCDAGWDKKCEGEAWPENEAVIPAGFTHCRTDARKNSGPTNDAGSWWWLDGNRVRVYARACGGPAYYQYHSSIDVNWLTYIVPAGTENHPENNCRPDTKGAADRELLCY